MLIVRIGLKIKCDRDFFFSVMCFFALNLKKVSQKPDFYDCLYIAKSSVHRIVARKKTAGKFKLV